MALQIIRASAKPEHAADLEAAAAKVFAALHELQPDGLRYASLRVTQDSYLILLEVADGAENPLPSIPASQEFQAGVPGWLSGPRSSRRQASSAATGSSDAAAMPRRPSPARPAGLAGRPAAPTVPFQMTLCRSR
jgi:hypothetical protein